MFSETSAKSEMTSSNGNRGVKRVKVAFFSLKLKRLLEMTILRTNEEVLVLNFLKVSEFKMKIKGIIVTKGDPLLTLIVLKMIIKVGFSVN